MSHTKDCVGSFYFNRDQIVSSVSKLDVVESATYWTIKAQRPFLPFYLNKAGGPAERASMANILTFKDLYYNIAIAFLTASQNYYNNNFIEFYQYVSGEYGYYLNAKVTGKPLDYNRFFATHEEWFQRLKVYTGATEDDMTRLIDAFIVYATNTSERLLFLSPGEYRVYKDSTLHIQLAAIKAIYPEFTLKVFEINSIG